MNLSKKYLIASMFCILLIAIVTKEIAYGLVIVFVFLYYKALTTIK